MAEEQIDMTERFTKEESPGLRDVFFKIVKGEWSGNITVQEINTAIESGLITEEELEPYGGIKKYSSCPMRKDELKDLGMNLEQLEIHNDEIRQWRHEGRVFVKKKYSDQRRTVVKLQDIREFRWDWIYSLLENGIYVKKFYKGEIRRNFRYKPKFMSMPYKVLKYVVEHKRVTRQELLKIFGYRVITVKELNDEIMRAERTISEDFHWSDKYHNYHLRAVNEGTFKICVSRTIQTLLGNNSHSGYLIGEPMIWKIVCGFYAPTENGWEVYKRNNMGGDHLS